MAKMFTSGFRPKSTTKKAKNIIRNEIKAYYADRDYGNGNDYVANMRDDIEAWSDNRTRNYSDMRKGKEMVNVGNLACYYSDQAVMLSKIYGKKAVDKWDGNKIHEIYGNLIGREYAAMLRVHGKKKGK